MSGCDHWWVPTCPTQDSRLMKAMTQLISSTPQEDVEDAFEHICSENSGISGSQSLVQDLIEKSGPSSHAYIEVALSMLQTYIVRATAGQDVLRVLLDESLSDYPDKNSESAVHIRWYRGCLWELFSSLVVAILTRGDMAAPASCFDALNRSRFLEEKLYST